MTWEFWLKPLSVNGTKVFFGKRPSLSSSDASYLHYMSGRNLTTRLYGFGGDQAVNGSSSGNPAYPFTAGEWSHIVIMWDGDATNELRYMINGKPRGPVNRDAIQDIADSNSPLFIGTANPGYANSYVGYIDEVTIYKRALTDQEAIDNYRMGQP